MAKEFQTEKVLNVAWEQKKPLTTGVLGHSRDTAVDVERVLSEEKAQLHSFFFCYLDTGVEASLYLLHCQSVFPSFQCYHDFIIAVPCSSTVRHKGASHTGIEQS